MVTGGDWVVTGGDGYLTTGDSRVVNTSVDGIVRVVDLIKATFTL